MSTIEERDLDLLKDVAVKEIKAIAVERKMTETAVRAWLYRIRKRITRWQNYVNRIRALQKHSARVRKFTTAGALPEDKVERFGWGEE